MPIAVNHYYKDNSGKYVDEVGYFDIETWGEKYAPYVEKYALQGRGVRIVGRLKQDRWKDADGKNYSKVKIIAEHIDFKPVKKGDLKTILTLHRRRTKVLKKTLLKFSRI